LEDIYNSNFSSRTRRFLATGYSIVVILTEAKLQRSGRIPEGRLSNTDDFLHADPSALNSSEMFRFAQHDSFDYLVGSRQFGEPIILMNKREESFWQGIEASAREALNARDYRTAHSRRSWRNEAWTRANS